MNSKRLYDHIVKGATYKTLAKITKKPATQVRQAVERYTVFARLTDPLRLRCWIKAVLVSAERHDLYSTYQIKDSYSSEYYIKKKGQELLEQTSYKDYPPLAEEIKKVEPSLTWKELASYFGVLEHVLSMPSLLIDYGVASKEKESWITSAEEMFEARKGGLGWKVISEFSGLSSLTVRNKVRDYCYKTDQTLPSMPQDTKTRRRVAYHLSNALDSWEEVVLHKVYTTEIACKYDAKHYEHYESQATPDDLPMTELIEEILMRAEEVEQAHAELEELIKVRDERRTLILQG